MAFVKISEILNQRLKHLGLENFFLEKEIQTHLESYLKGLGFSADEVCFKKFKNKTLTLACRHSTISAELKSKEPEILNFLRCQIPSLKIEKIFYQLD
jgi:hypothetical protein